MDLLDVVVAVPSALVSAVVVAVVVRRLLGVALGLGRTTLAGLLVLAIIPPINRAILPDDPDTSAAAAGWLLLLSVCLSLLAAMVVLVVAEVLVPSGSIPGPAAMLRAVRGRSRRTRRYVEIIRILARHRLIGSLRGLGRAQLATPQARRDKAAELRAALEEAGATFVKLGQLLSTRRDLLPAEFVEELAGLHDRAAPLPWAEVEAVVVDELNVVVTDAFAVLDTAPVAAASVAQVHAARLPDGSPVVVKVQRPDVAEQMRRDLELIDRLAQLAERRTRWGRAIGARALARGFAESVADELDFRVEARNLTAAASGAAAGHAIRVPAPIPGLCTQRLLVMQRLNGLPLSAAPATLSLRVREPHELAERLFECMLDQVLVDGLFHADPHPGNVFLLPDDNVGLLDFGSVGRLDAALRAGVQQLLLAMDRGDPVAMADTVLDLVDRPDDLDVRRLERALGRFLARHLGPGGALGVPMFTELFRIATDFGLALPAEVVAVFRMMGTLEGTLLRLAPGFDVVAAARRYGARRSGLAVEPSAVPRQVADELVALLPALRRLPRQMERLIGGAERGSLAVHLRLLSDGRDRKRVTGLLHQVLLTLLGAASGIIAALLLGTPGGPAFSPGVSLYQLIGYNLLVVATVLSLRVLVLVFRRDE